MDDHRDEPWCLVEAEQIAAAASRSHGGNVGPVDQIGILLSNVMLSDAEARLLAYVMTGGSVEMTVRDIASLFGWSERKAYYVLAALEERGFMRRAARGKAR